MAKNQIKFRQISLLGDTFEGSAVGQISLKDASSVSTGVTLPKLAHQGSGAADKGVVLGNSSQTDVAISKVLFQRTGSLVSAANELVTADLIKAAIDASSAGLSWKQSVLAHNASTETDVSSGYNAGTDTLTLDATSRYKLDGVFLGTCGPSLGNGPFVDHEASLDEDQKRILISGEDSNQNRNGIYALATSVPPFGVITLNDGGSFNLAEFNNIEYTIIAPDSANAARTETFKFLTGAGTNGANNAGTIEVRIDGSTDLAGIASKFKSAVEVGNCEQVWREGISRIDVNGDAGGDGIIKIYAFQHEASANVTNAAVTEVADPNNRAAPTAWALGSAATMVRTSDADGPEELSSAAVFVSQGTTRDDRAYVQSEMLTDIDTSNQIWVQFTGAYKITSADGSVTISGDDISVASGGVGQAQLDQHKLDIRLSTSGGGSDVSASDVTNGFLDVAQASLASSLHSTASSRAAALAGKQDDAGFALFLNGIRLEASPSNNAATDGDFSCAAQANGSDNDFRIVFASGLLSEGDIVYLIHLAS